MHACMHTSMHACMHACIHTYIHAYIHTSVTRKSYTPVACCGNSDMVYCLHQALL